MARQPKNSAQTQTASKTNLAANLPSAPARQEEPKREEPTVTAEQIAQRAYEIYLARGGENGSDQADWYQAERELKLGKQ